MSQMEAYKRAGYKGNARGHAWNIVDNSGIRQAIDEKLTKITKSVEDAIKQTAMQAFETEKDLMLTAENEFARIKASQDILDRAGLKPMDKLEQRHSGNIKIEFEYFDTPQETDDIDDDNETISE